MRSRADRASSRHIVEDIKCIVGARDNDKAFCVKTSAVVFLAILSIVLRRSNHMLLEKPDLK